MIGTLERRDAELERAAVASACRRYLVAVRTAAPERYDEVEEAAWRDLLRALERLHRPLGSPGPPGGSADPA